MKSSRYLALVPFLALLVHCQRDNQATHGSTVPVIQSHVSPSFISVANHLELGGHSFQYTDESGLWMGIAKALDGISQSLPIDARNELPPGFSYVTVLQKLGLDGLKATGSSSRLMDDGRYHSRSFAHFPDGRRGLATLGGGEAEPFLFHKLAPTGTDLALEMPLHFKSMAGEWLQEGLAYLDPATRQMLEPQIDQPVPPLGLSPRQLLEKLDLRIGLLLRLNPGPEIVLPNSPPVPNADVLLVVERVGWLLEPLKTQFMPMVQSGMLPVDVHDGDGVLIISFKQPLGPAPMDFQPVLRYEVEADRLLVASRGHFLQAALSAEGKLAEETEFQTAWTGLPVEGNSALYISANFQKTVRGLVRQSITLSKEMSRAEAESAHAVLDAVSPYLTKPQAACAANLKDGTLGVANLSFPASSLSGISQITTLAIIASVAVPTVNTIQNKAAETSVIAHGSQIHTALKRYLAINSRLPEYLNDLPAPVINAKPYLWLYDTTINPYGDGMSIIMAEDIPRHGKRAVVRLNGTVEFISDDVFRAAQNPSLTKRYQ